MKRLLTGLAALFVVVAVGVVGASTALATKPPEHKVTICHATPPDTAAQGWVGITVDVASVGYQHSGHQDQHAADIIPAWSYTDSDGNTVSYAGKNLGDLGAFGFPGVNGADVLANGCVLPDQPPGNPTVVSPIPPTVTKATCSDPEIVVVKFDGGVNGQPAGVHVDVQGELTGPGHVIVTFSPEEGYTFPEGTQTVYTYDLSGPVTDGQCEAVTPVPPTTAPAGCETPESLTIPQQPEGVIVMVGTKRVTVRTTYSGPAEDVSVVFSPAAGFFFPDGTKTVYTYDLKGAAPGACGGNPPKQKCAKNDAQCQAAKLPQGVSDQQLIEDSGSRVQGG